MFNLAHILFIVISFLALAVTFILCHKFIKDEKKKNIVLVVAAILTVLLHYSPLYVDYLSTGSAEISDTMILPIYPCNVAMWLLVALAFAKNKKSKVFEFFAIITFYLGTIGGIIGIVFNEIYANTPTLSDWDVLHGLLSHVTLILGSVYLLVGGYIKIRVSNLFAIFCGELLLLLDGALVLGLFKACGLELLNFMYLLSPPLDSMPWLNIYLIGIMFLALMFVVTVIVEHFTVPSEQRWYKKFKKGETKK